MEKLEAEYELLKNQNQELEKKILSTEKLVKMAQEEIDVLTHDNNKQNEEIINLKNQIKKLKSEIEMLKNQLSEVELTHEVEVPV